MAEPQSTVLPMFHFEQVPTFYEPSPNTLGLALGLNEFGEVVGISDDAELRTRGFLYSNGEIEEVPGLFPGAASHPRAVNLWGEVAGSAERMVRLNGHLAGVSTPVLGPPQALSNLLTAEEDAVGRPGTVYAFNSAGIAALETNESLFIRADGTRQAIGFADTPEGFGALIGEMNELGQLVGSARRISAGHRMHAIWMDLGTGEVRDLHDSRAQESFAHAINNRGVVVGAWIRNSDGRTVPVRWSQGQPELLPFLGQDEAGWTARAVDINDAGDILGYSSRNGERRDWLILGGEGQPRALSSLDGSAVDPRFDRFMAFAINNAREIAGAAITEDANAPLGSRNKPGLLRPLFGLPPERPSTGLWADLQKAGSGIEINRVGEDHFVLWYSYDDQGRPMWFGSDAIQLERGVWRADLYEHRRNAAGVISRTAVGRGAFTTLNSRNILFHWKLGSRSGTERYEFLLSDCARTANAESGSWFEAAKPGYGFSLARFDGRWAGVGYLYDQAGAPRWVFVDMGPGLRSAPVKWFEGGACPGCDYIAPMSRDLGQLTLDVVSGGLQHSLTVTAGAGAEGLNWSSNAQLTRLSSEMACR